MIFKIVILVLFFPYLSCLSIDECIEAKIQSVVKGTELELIIGLENKGDENLYITYGQWTFQNVLIANYNPIQGYPEQEMLMNYFLIRPYSKKEKMENWESKGFVDESNQDFKGYPYSNHFPMVIKLRPKQKVKWEILYKNDTCLKNIFNSTHEIIFRTSYVTQNIWEKIEKKIGKKINEAIMKPKTLYKLVIESSNNYDEVKRLSLIQSTQLSEIILSQIEENMVRKSFNKKKQCGGLILRKGK